MAGRLRARSPPVNSPEVVGGGTDWWNTPSTPYLVPNSPPNGDIIALEAGDAGVTNKITFSQPVLNPVMAIMSMGRTYLPVDYSFDQPFDIVISAHGHFGGDALALSDIGGDVLRGAEGHGVIQFRGAVTSITWVDTPGEYWHGFTIGIEGLPPAGSTVPLPAPLLMGGIGLLGLAIRRRRQR